MKWSQRCSLCVRVVFPLNAGDFLLGCLENASILDKEPAGDFFNIPSGEMVDIHASPPYLYQFLPINRLSY